MKYEKPELEKLELMSPYMFVSCSVDDPDWDPDVPDDDGPSYKNPEDDLW